MPAQHADRRHATPVQRGAGCDRFAAVPATLRRVSWCQRRRYARMEENRRQWSLSPAATQWQRLCLTPLNPAISRFHQAGLAATGGGAGVWRQTGRSTDAGVDRLLSVQLVIRDLRSLAQSAHAVIFSFVIIAFLSYGCTYKGTGQWGLESFSNHC